MERFGSASEASLKRVIRIAGRGPWIGRVECARKCCKSAQNAAVIDGGAGRACRAQARRRRGAAELAPLRRSRTRSESRSSSCAQTAEAHATVTTPSRSATGSRGRRERLAGGGRPGPLDLGEQRRGRERGGQPSSAAPTGRGARAPHAGDLVSRHALPSATDEARDVGPVAARHVGEVGRRDHALAAALAQQLDEPLAAQRVELAHDVVEQHQRRGPALGGQHAALGQQQRQQPEPLLAARPVGAQLAAGAAEHELVAVRAVAGEAALEVGVDALGELGGQLLRRLGAASAAGRRAPRRPRARAPRRARRTAGRSRSTAAARSAASATPWRASSASHAGSEPRPARPARIAAEQRVALRRARRRRRGACRTRAGHSAAITWSRCARRSAGAPSTSSSRSGRKTETSGRAAASVRRSTGAPSTCRRFASPGSKPTVMRCASPSRSASSSSRATPAPKRTTSRSFAVRHERPVQAK